MITDQNTCLRDIIGDNVELEQFKNNPDFQEFQRKIKEIIELGARHEIPAGNLLLLIGKIFNLSWNTIPAYKFSEIENWLTRNWYREFEITNPSVHKDLMETSNEYSNWYNLMASQTKKGRFYGDYEKD